MANYKVPFTGNAQMYDGIQSIQQSVRKTLVADTVYTDFDSLRTNCNNALIDGTYGTQNSTPTSSNDFRGYPRPTVDMDFVVEATGTSPAAIYENLVCAPTLNNIIGFDITITVTITEEIASVGIPQIHDETFTFLAGNTSPTSSTLTLVGGTYQCNTTYDMPPTTENIDISANLATNSDYYQVGGSIVDTLAYTAALTVYSHTIQAFPAASCGFNAGGTDITAYSLDSVIANGTQLFSNASLTTYYASGSYSSPPVSDFIYDWWSQSATGIVSGFTSCS